MQRQLGVSQPDYGHLTDDMIHLEHVPLELEAFLQPRVEPEIAFVPGQATKGPGVTVAEAIAVDFVLPALEIIDSRIRDWRMHILDTIASNASSGGVVLGSTPVGVRDVDLGLSRLHRPAQWRGGRYRRRRRRPGLTAVVPSGWPTPSAPSDHPRSRPHHPARVADRGDPRSPRATRPGRLRRYRVRHHMLHIHEHHHSQGEL